MGAVVRVRTRARVAGAFALAPPVGVFFISLIAPRAFGPMFAHPVIAGIRPEDWVTIFAVAWGVIGGVAVAESKSLAGIVAAFLIFTVPACLAILLAPAVVLILRSLA